MKKQNIKYQTEESQEIKKFILVLLIIIVLIVGVYFLSKFFVKSNVAELTYQTGKISTNTAIVGTILNNPENEYYVLAYDSTGTNASAYITYANYYEDEQKNAIKIYYLDLNNGFNKTYYVTENSNPKATKISELKIKDGTLLKIKKGKITEYIEGLEKIANKLKVTEKSK